MVGTRSWLGAVVAATGCLSVVPMYSAAQAADLGGDCCADLEERIAELEATTARKGNRKVSLTVSGQVNQAVFFWDDGSESNTYVGTNSLEQDRFRFVGEAKITGDWSAGYVLEIGVNGAPSSAFSQESDGSGASAANQLSDRKAAWFLKSKSLGKVQVGKTDNSTYHLIDNPDFLLTRGLSYYEAAGAAMGSFQIRQNGVLTTTRWTQVMAGFQNASAGQAALRNVVRYDTPTFAGFTGTASWGEDDMWDMALYYKGEVGDFKLAASLGYGESTDTASSGGNRCNGLGADCQWWGGGATIQHVPTGLFVYGGYGANELDLAKAGLTGDDKSETWYVQAGIERKWLPLGATNIFGEYRNDEVGRSTGAASADLDFWAVGVVQSIDAAAMSLYTIYRHADGEVGAGGGVTAGSIDDFDMVISGARILF